MNLRAAIVLQAAYAAAAAVLLAVAHVSPPPPRLGTLPAIALGLGVALALRAVLARKTAPCDRRLLLPALGAGATEEIVWRWGVLAGTAPSVGWGGALALSSVGFAYRHTRSTGMLAYLALGVSFGGVFLATGRLAAAIAAHTAYNALVLLRRPG